MEVTGFEPATSSLPARRSTSLSYTPRGCPRASDIVCIASSGSVWAGPDSPSGRPHGYFLFEPGRCMTTSFPSACLTQMRCLPALPSDRIASNAAMRRSRLFADFRPLVISCHRSRFSSRGDRGAVVLQHARAVQGTGCPEMGGRSCWKSWPTSSDGGI